jgi:predicted N-acetyltransferase YhbS
VSDFSYVTYLSDIAVAREFQRQGLGRALIEGTRQAAPAAKIVLLSAPAAAEYYPHIGFSRHNSAWVLPPV